jgi:DivIVA domain-containing protein
MPADVHNVAFSKPPLGKRGYHEDEVDAFLDVVEAELARVIEQNKELRNQVEKLDWRCAEPVDCGADCRPVERSWPVMAPVAPAMRDQLAPGGEHHVAAAKVLGLAQEMTERLTGEAKAEADGMLCDARVTCEQLVSEAMAKADGMVNEARARAEALLSDARSRADTRHRQSREKAVCLETDAAREQAEIVAALSLQKRVLEKEIEELRGFEREYRTRLKTYLDSQLRGLLGRGSIAPGHSWGV